MTDEHIVCIVRDCIPWKHEDFQRHLSANTVAKTWSLKRFPIFVGVGHAMGKGCLGGFIHDRVFILHGFQPIESCQFFFEVAIRPPAPYKMY